MKNYLFVISFFLLYSCAHSQTSNVNSATQGSSTVSQISNANPIAWEPLTVSQDTISMKYKNTTSVNDTISSVDFTLDYYNNSGIKKRVDLIDKNPPDRNKSTTTRWTVSSLDIDTAKSVSIFDIKVRFSSISNSDWLLSASVPVNGNPSVYIEKSLYDILNGNLSTSEAYLRDGRGNLYHKIVSNVYLKEKHDDSQQFTIIYDNEGNELVTEYSNEFFIKYRIEDNNDFRPEKQYRVKFMLHTLYETIADMYATIESIDGLLTFNEVQSIAKAERQRAEEVEAEKRRVEAQATQKSAEEEAAQIRLTEEAEAAKKKAEAEAAFQVALSSRNADTIIRFLRSGEINVLSYKRSGEVRDEGILAAAKIISRDNNAEIGDFDASFVDSTINPINPYAFTTDKIYQLAIVQPQQFIEGKIIAIAVPGFPNTTIVLQNIPNLQNVSGSLLEVFMKYTGITTLRLANGTIKEVASFSVLYHYQSQ